MTLSRDQILAAEASLPTESVEVPEWGGAVLVRGLTASEADAFLASTVKQRGTAGAFDRTDFQAKICQLCLVDDQGQPMFGKEDVPALGKKSARALARIAPVAMRLSGLAPEDVEGLKGN